MDQNKQKEEFSLAYLHALVSVAGFKFEYKRVDDNSIDCTIDSSISSTGVDYLDIKIQLNATSRDIVP